MGYDRMEANRITLELHTKFQFGKLSSFEEMNRLIDDCIRDIQTLRQLQYNLTEQPTNLTAVIDDQTVVVKSHNKADSFPR